MDETTLTTTLRSLAAEPVLHTAPSADAKARARRLQRNRRIGAGGLVVTVGLVVGGVTLPHSDDSAGTGATEHDWQRELAEPTFPNHATSQTVVVLDSAKGSVLFAAYWQGMHLCTATVTSGALDGSECASVTPSAGAPITVANIGNGKVFASVTAAVSQVRATTTDGHVVRLHPLGGDRFPYRVVVAGGKVASLRAYDDAGHQLGDAVAGPDALQVRQVRSSADCSSTALSTPTVPSSTGTTCYQLDSPAMSLVPQKVDALDDPTQGWLVQVSLSAADVATFGRVTSVVATASHTQLALVWNGKVVSAVKVEQAITGGQFQITGDAGTAGFTEQQAKALAAALAD